MKFTLPGKILPALILGITGASADGSDWPMWRNDAGRRASVKMTMPDKPELIWTRQLEEPARCWPFQYEDYYTGGNPDKIGKLSFDISYEPVIGEGKLFVPSMVSDRLSAYSTETGEELWRFYAGGPVRFAPVYNSGRVYFVSDDGYLYCIDATTGNLIWQFKGSYSDRMVLGNERIISMWPARGGPVLKNGVIYFAAGVIPFEGVFIHAVDAISGEKIWTNSTSGSLWELHQHGGAYSFGGPSPQGYLAISGDKLIVPGGRTPPAVFDIKTGKFLYFNLSSRIVGKGAGGYRIFASDDWFFNHGMLYAAEDGAQFGAVPGDVITQNAFIGISENHLIAHNSHIRKKEVEIIDRLQREAIKKTYEIDELWKVKVDHADRLYFKTDSHFVISRYGGETVSLVTISTDGSPGDISWEYKTEGIIWTMLAGNNKLFVVTTDGKVYCFGSKKSASPRYYSYSPLAKKPGKKSSALANSMLQHAGAAGGYGLIYGESNTDLIKALTQNSSMHLIISGSDPEKTRQLRNELDNAGLYGKRVSVVDARHLESALLPYIYDIIVVNQPDYLPDQIRKVFNSLRPYGGSAFILSAGKSFPLMINELALENAVITREKTYTILTRKDALLGSAQWTHQYASASNRTYSDDSLVKPPLGTLWFGGPSNVNVLPRHHLGPVPQAAGGRLLIMGVETLNARCVYTGRELWVKELPGIGHRFTNLELEEQFRAGKEVYMSCHPGANVMGSPYVTLEDGIYIIYNDKILYLDPSTGKTISEFHLPVNVKLNRKEWGHIMVWGEYLIATADPIIFQEGGVYDQETWWNDATSRYVAVMNRYDGKLLWTREAAKTGFRHNTIVAGNNKIFAVDGLSEGIVKLLQRRGIEDNRQSVLLALDIKTGEILWEDENAFGTWLGYYEDKDILIEGGRYGGKRNLSDEPRNQLIARTGINGKTIWTSSERYSGSLGLHPEMIISGRPGEPVFNPYTGEAKRMSHPVTGEEYNWDWHKYYGCGTINTSRYLMAFRSGSAGYNDLCNFGGTTNISGWKAGCTNNLIIAEGMLNGPDYTRTCTCSYPLQSSFGLTYMPDAGIEMWSLNKIEIDDEIVRSLGINFGASGNRKENEVLWFEYPKLYTEGPDLPIKVETTSSEEYFRNHATWIKNPAEKYNWVASYGIKGIKSVEVKLNPNPSGNENFYNVTLFFAEPEEITIGQRIFNVSLQGNIVLENFDIVQQAGGPRMMVKKEFRNISVNNTLLIEFSDNISTAIICGVEIVQNENIISDQADFKR